MSTSRTSDRGSSFSNEDLVRLAAFVRVSKKFFPDFTIQSINADAAYGSSDFFQECAQIYPKTQPLAN